MAFDLKEYSCSICSDMLNNPVTIPCGHSYCMDCIEMHWDQQGVNCSCLKCGKTFNPRPDLAKNVMLTTLLEQLKKAGLSTPLTDPSHGKQGDVNSNVTPSNKVQDIICSQHNKEMDLFCRTDQQLICYLCSVDQHKGHDTVIAAAERAEKQGGLSARKTLLLQSLQQKETDLEKLQQNAKDIIRSAQTAVERTGDSFREMALLLEKRRSEVEQQIRSEEQTLLGQGQELQDQLQRDITELKRNISELDALSLTPNHSQFLQCYYSVSIDTEKPEPVKIQAEPQRYFEGVTTAVSKLQDKLKPTVEADLSPEPIIRVDFLRYSTDITLDPDTANNSLSLSDENRRATIVNKHHGYPDLPERFSQTYQVMSKESLTGRRYFEVEWSTQWVVIAASYGDIDRKGNCNISNSGSNDKSWALQCDTGGYTFYHNSVQSSVSGPVSSRIGVYLDHSAGTLAFYSLQDKTMTLLHKVQTTFSQPLYAVVRFWNYGGTTLFPKLE